MKFISNLYSIFKEMTDFELSEAYFDPKTRPIY